MSEEMDLPNGWLGLEFGDLFSKPGDDVVDGPFGSNLKASEYVSVGVPIARLQNIDRNTFVAKNTQYVTTEKAEELARHTFVPGDILITKLGDPLGKACLAPDSIARGVLVADVVRARLTHEWVDRRFLCYQINAGYIIEQFKDQTKGTTRPRVNLTKIRGLKARLCPLREQTRIVAKLEELLSGLDAGVAELKAAQKKLAQYRQSLLKAAVEGALTEEWRQHNTPAETGAQLLERILTERRARWETKQLARFAEQGKKPPKDWQKKYPEPVQPDTSDLPELSEGWVWASVDQISPDDLANGRSVPSADAGAKVLRLTAVRDGRIDLNEYKHGAWSAEEAKQFAVTEGDLLIVRGNGSISLVGRAGLVGKVTDQVAFPDTMIRLRVVERVVSSSWVSLLWNSRFVRQHLERRARTSAGIYKISQPDIVSSTIPVPPLSEQKHILQLFEKMQEQLEAAQSALNFGHKQSTAQRQNILRTAFAGELVPQDPTDEPASVLLERIRAERAAQAAAKKPRGRRTRA